MNLEKLETNRNNIRTWMKENESPLNDALEGLLTASELAKTDDEAVKYWSSIRSLCGNMSPSPVRKGVQSKYSTEVLAVLDAIGTEVDEASIRYHNDGIMSKVLFSHGKSGGKTMLAEEFGKTMRNMTIGKLKKKIDDGIWDGTLAGLDSLTEITEDNE